MGLIYIVSLLSKDSWMHEPFSYRDTCCGDFWLASLPSRNLLANFIYARPSRWLCVIEYSWRKLQTQMRVISAIIQVAFFLARNCFCGSCAAVVPRKSFSIQGGLRPCCWDSGCAIRGGDLLQEKFSYLIETICLTVDWKKHHTNVPYVLVNPLFRVELRVRKVM